MAGEPAASRGSGPRDASGCPKLHRRGARGVSIGRDLARLTAHPTGRDPTLPGYQKVARYVARRLARRGTRPAGDGARGPSRYLQRFAWDQRFTSGQATSENVVGIRRGEGATREAVLVIAHLDGLSDAEKRWYERSAPAGKKVESMAGYQGANDNASAVAAALYISDALGRLERRRGRRLRRDVVFLFPSAEEEGLKGTEAFARFSRRLGDRKIVGVVNFEMVGRGDRSRILLYGGDTAPAAEENPLFGRGTRLAAKGNMARVVPGHLHDLGEHWFKRSDHYVFSQAGIPSVMYLGEPGAYHTPADDLSSLDRKTNLAVARHALRLVVDLANDPGPVGPGRALPFASSTGYAHGQVYQVAPSAPKRSQGSKSRGSTGGRSPSASPLSLPAIASPATR